MSRGHRQHLVGAAGHDPLQPAGRGGTRARAPSARPTGALCRVTTTPAASGRRTASTASARGPQPVRVHHVGMPATARSRRVACMSADRPGPPAISTGANRCVRAKPNRAPVSAGPATATSTPGAASPSTRCRTWPPTPPVLVPSTSSTRRHDPADPAPPRGAVDGRSDEPVAEHPAVEQVRPPRAYAGEDPQGQRAGEDARKRIGQHAAGIQGDHHQPPGGRTAVAAATRRGGTGQATGARPDRLRRRAETSSQVPATVMPRVPGGQRGHHPVRAEPADQRQSRPARSPIR